MIIGLVVSTNFGCHPWISTSPHWRWSITNFCSFCGRIAIQQQPSPQNSNPSTPKGVSKPSPLVMAKVRPNCNTTKTNMVFAELGLVAWFDKAKFDAIQQTHPEDVLCTKASQRVWNNRHRLEKPSILPKQVIV
jgi:hypothetical protein